MLGEAARPNVLDRADNASVKDAPLVPEQTRVDDLEGQRVLECVLKIGEQRGLVEELGGLEVGEPTTQVFLGLLGNGEQEPERHALADDRGRLEYRLSSGDRRSMRAARIAWTVGGSWIA